MSTLVGSGSRLTTAAVKRWNPPAAGTDPSLATARTQVELSQAARRSASSSERVGAT